MNGCTFNAEQIKKLETNHHVTSVSDRSIQYKEEFKVHSLCENLVGKRSIEIFEENGFRDCVIVQKTFFG